MPVCARAPPAAASRLGPRVPFPSGCAPGRRRRRQQMRAGGGRAGAARGARAGGAGALQGPAAAGSNGEAGAGPANYISGTSIIRGKTRKRWRPAPGGPLPERPGPSLPLLLPPPPHGAPAPPRPRRDPDPGPASGHSAGQPRAGRCRLRRGCAQWPDSQWDRRTRGLAVSGGAGDSEPHSLPAHSSLSNLPGRRLRAPRGGGRGLASRGAARQGEEGG